MVQPVQTYYLNLKLWKLITGIKENDKLFLLSFVINKRNPSFNYLPIFLKFIFVITQFVEKLDWQKSSISCSHSSQTLPHLLHRPTSHLVLPHAIAIPNCSSAQPSMAESNNIESYIVWQCDSREVIVGPEVVFKYMSVSSHEDSFHSRFICLYNNNIFTQWPVSLLPLLAFRTSSSHLTSALSSMEEVCHVRQQIHS
jgi:hypothetical protein